MGQPRISPGARKFFANLLIGALLCGCGKSLPAKPTNAKSPKAVSLVPAATDLIVGMSATAHLVGVSNYEGQRPETRDLPRVGDYQSTDWERIGVLKPDLLIIQIDPSRVPAGLTQRAQERNIRLVNLKIARLEDLYAALRTLGEALGENDKAAAGEKRLRQRFAAVQQRVAGRQKVSALIFFGDEENSIIGHHTFLDDVLTLAGGTNAAKDIQNDYPSIDREKLEALDPEVIIQLLPDASEQVKARAQRYWRDMPNLRAVKNGRICTLTESYVLQPGFGMGKVAEAFADGLHPQLKTKTAP